MGNKIIPLHLRAPDDQIRHDIDTRLTLLRAATDNLNHCQATVDRLRREIDTLEGQLTTRRTE